MICLLNSRLLQQPSPNAIRRSALVKTRPIADLNLTIRLRLQLSHDPHRQLHGRECNHNLAIVCLDALRNDFIDMRFAANEQVALEDGEGHSRVHIGEDESMSGAVAQRKRDVVWGWVSRGGNQRNAVNLAGKHDGREGIGGTHNEPLGVVTGDEDESSGETAGDGGGIDELGRQKWSGFNGLDDVGKHGAWRDAVHQDGPE